VCWHYLLPPVNGDTIERPRRRGRKGEGAHGGAEHGHRRSSVGAGAGAAPAIALDPTSRLIFPGSYPAAATEPQYIVKLFTAASFPASTITCRDPPPASPPPPTAHLVVHPP
jgi:hypothetical protein